MGKSLPADICVFFLTGCVSPFFGFVVTKWTQKQVICRVT